MLNIKTFYCNPYRECTYVVSLPESNDCIIIDPGMYGEKEEERVRNYLKENTLTLCAVLITHAHPDHICGLDSLLQQYPNLPVYGKIYNLPDNNLMKICGIDIQVIPTPGHKEDCVCFYLAEHKILFTGDTLFQESVGRTDLPGGDTATLMQSLEQLCLLPDDTKVYPGHGLTTTIGYEKENNPYL